MHQMSKKIIEDLYPLSPMQSGLLFQILYDPDSDAYFVQGIFDIKGFVDASFFHLAWQKLSECHPMLRTGFVWENLEHPLQYVLESVEVPFYEYDWRSFGEKEQDEKIKIFLQEDRKKGFDLSQAPVFRVFLIRKSDDTYCLIWSHHHILMDGWCVPILLKDLFQVYKDSVSKKITVLPKMPPYREYIEWLQKQDMKKSETFWENYLAGFDASSRFSFKKLIKEKSNEDYKIYFYSFSREETDSFRKFSQDYFLTLNTLVQGAIGITLQRYTNGEDLLMGVTVSGRDIDLRGVEQIIGLFINTLPLRINSTKEESAISFLKNLQSQAQEISHYSYTSLAQIQSWKRSEGSLFDITYAFENYPVENDSCTTDFPFVTSSSGSEKTEYPLAINVGPDSQLHLRLSYYTKYFHEDFIERFVLHIKNIINSIVRNPHDSILSYPLVSCGEYDEIVYDWNGTDFDGGSGDTLDGLFESQVLKTPDGIALVYEGIEVSYDSLNERSNRLAHYLRGLGVGCDTLVGLCVDRSIEMVVGILGIMKAGGAYVPLDPTYPEERIQFILTDTACPIILTTEAIADKLPATSGLLICLDTEERVIAQASEANLDLPRDPQSLAYVIYTSGSTGKPKGVMISHENLAHYVAYCKEKYPYRCGAGFFHSSFSFDMSITSIFLPLVTGNPVFILPYDANLDLFVNIIQEYDGFGFIKVTPTHLKALKDRSIRSEYMTLVLGGEALLSDDLKFIAESPGINIINEYGPTEATVGCCVFEVRADILPSFDSIPIGRPIWNTHLYILDGGLNPVPVGIGGELYIGGVGLARGYLNRPDLTADRFIPNPFYREGSSSSFRLYRTGDLARYRSDGVIEFSGRIDDQVKIRGFRIELGEIESTLQGHGEVHQSVVLAREDEGGDKKLVAYVVAREGEAFSEATPVLDSCGESFSIMTGGDSVLLTEDLQAHLRSSLPDYMIPAFFVYVDRLPLTANGKIDRKSLPAPDLSHRQVGDSYVAARTEIEASLCAIWSDVLKMSPIGIHDNFFKLGGHSLLATQVISRIRSVFERDIPLRVLFEEPTIARLGEKIEASLGEGKGSLLPVITAGVRPDRIPLSFAQQRLWFIDQLLPNSSLYNIPIALRIKGPLDRDILDRSLWCVIDRHEALRTVFAGSDGEAHQVIQPSFGLGLVSGCLDLRDEPHQEDRLQDLIKEEITKPFKLWEGPLIRGKLICLSEDEHVLVMTLHHIVSDGWSMDIFFREVGYFYGILQEGIESSLESLSIQYGDFSIWQRGWLCGDVLAEQLSYWRDALSGIPDLLPLPTDHPRPRELSYVGSSYRTRLSAEMRRMIESLSQAHGASVFMTLLSVFQILLYRYTGEQDIVVGSPIANRHYKETEDLIGFFVNTLALRTRFRGDESFLDVLGSVIKTTLGAYQHQDVPFEQLVDHLNIRRELNRNPVFQVLFTFQNAQSSNPFVLRGLDVSPVSFPYAVAKFDLSIDVYDEGEGFGLEISYAEDLFEESTVIRLMDHFKGLVSSIVKSPHDSIVSYPLVSCGEYDEIVYDWNGTDFAYGSGDTLDGLFESQVLKTPDGIALVYEGVEVSYECLNERSNRLAHYLRGLGVGCDTLVGLCVDRSIEMVVGILGIMKAGGAYVPLDPTYPEERIQFILTDTACPIILTDSSYGGLFHFYEGRLVFLDDSSSLDAYPSFNLDKISSPQNLAYIIYTSGSTGKPKGVMVAHQGVCNRLSWMQNAYQLTTSDRVIQKTPFSFDVSVWELFWPILVGATEVVAAPNDHKDPTLLSQLIKDQKVSICHFVPSMLDNFLDIDTLSFCDSLRVVITSGEALSPFLVEKYFSNVRCSLHNLYGPTEASIDVSHYPCFSDSQALTIPIGRPIWNTQLYILDGGLNPVPVGIGGELYIGGVGLARGYLNRPDLTADRFIPNPFYREGSSSSFRLYRTGDLARYRSDGVIEFLGRIDDQVKIRGFRIELGEIESTLQGHGDVHQSVVLAREDEGGDKKLVAYVVSREGEAFSEATPVLDSCGESFSIMTGGDSVSLTEDLQAHLRSSLPDYMIPAFFVYVDRLPLTANGKIDRKSLLSIDTLTSERELLIYPMNAIQLSVMRIWEDVLKIDNIGITQNFFAIGGNSILAIKVVIKIKDILLKDISIIDIFKNPTIYSISLLLEDSYTNPINPPVVCIKEKGSGLPLLMIHPGGGLSYAYAGLARYLSNPIYGLNNPYFQNPEDSDESIQKLAELYIDMMKTIQLKGPYYLGGWSFGGLIALEMAQQLQRQDNIHSLILIDIGYPENNDSDESENIDLLTEENDVYLKKIIDRYNFDLMERNIEQSKVKVSNYKPYLYNGKTFLLMANNSLNVDKKKNAWKKYFTDVKMIDIPGTHQTLFDPDFVQSTSVAIAQVLK
jgi:amino acid adenylation domain-containing protein